MEKYKLLKAIKALERNNIKTKKGIVFVNKIMNIGGTGYVIKGYMEEYKIKDYGKTWVLSNEEIKL